MRVLYYSMVDWKWIKQRPHFITIYLNRMGIETDYAYPRIIGREQIRKTGFVKNLDSNKIRKLPINQIPKERAISLIFLINEIWRKIQVKRLISRNQYDVVVLTHPNMFSAMPEKRSFKLIYEMMDDYVELSNVVNKKVYFSQESQLCSAADTIVTSSESLKRILMNRCSVSFEKIHVIPNAFEQNSMLLQDSDESDKDEKQKTNKLLSRFNIKPDHFQRSLVYIGTISHWIDVASLTQYAAAHEDDAILLIGPVENLDVSVLAKLRSYDNIFLTGPVEHAQVGRLINLGTIMLIPFRVNPLIESVDPVKMYEYIYYQKPIVCSYWLELKKFAPFVSFYNDREPSTFESAVDDSIRFIIDHAQFANFIQQNDWRERVRTYSALITENMVK